MINRTILIIALYQISNSAIFSVDTVYRKCFSFSEPCAIPVVRSSDSLNNHVVERINATIEERFMMSPSDTSVECRWIELDFKAELHGKYLWISWYGTYYGAYDNSMSEVFLFRIDNEDYLTEKADVPDFPIPLFFKPETFSLIFPNWNDSCSSQMKEALECAEGSEPYCSCFHPHLELTDTSLITRLDYDCYPRVIRACAPYLSIEKPLSTLKSFLSPLGIQVLLKTKYLSLEPFGRFLLYQNYMDSLENAGVDFNSTNEAFFDILLP